MRKKVFLTGILTFVVAFGLILAGCALFGNEEIDNGDTKEESDDSGNTVVTQTAIGGVAAPVTGATPVTTVTETLQYNGAVTWMPAVTTFAPNAVYSASITLTAKPGYTFTGVPANAFTVAGSTMTTNPANTGTVTVIFPGTVAEFTPKTNEDTENSMDKLGLVGTGTPTSSNEGIARAEITGGRIKITSVSAGTAIITVKDVNNHEAIISVRVADNGAIDITITKYTVNDPFIGGVWINYYPGRVNYKFSESNGVKVYATSTGSSFNVAGTYLLSNSGSLLHIALTPTGGGGGTTQTKNYEMTESLLVFDKGLGSQEFFTKNLEAGGAFNGSAGAQPLGGVWKNNSSAGDIWGFNDKYEFFRYNLTDSAENKPWWDVIGTYRYDSTRNELFLTYNGNGNKTVGENVTYSATFAAGDSQMTLIRGDGYVSIYTKQ